ncbi:MAG: GDYXXLXY domain-containing protein [Alphaproteobacteria bacterium]
MSIALRASLFLGGIIVALAIINVQISKKESLRQSGGEILLPLRPVDPRSLMQGDYMVLHYAILPDTSAPDSGTLVLALDQKHIAKFQRLDDGSPVGPTEQRLHYKRTFDGQVRVGAESFFFQEGQRDRYSAARYAILHVSPEGEALLIGLADEKGEIIQRVNESKARASVPQNQ